MSMVWPTLESRTAKEQKGEDHSSPMIENQGHRSVSKIRQKCQKCTPLAYSSEAYKGPAALLNQLKIKKCQCQKYVCYYSVLCLMAVVVGFQNGASFELTRRDMQRGAAEASCSGKVQRCWCGNAVGLTSILDPVTVWV